jgi:hypothetical protein
MHLAALLSLLASSAVALFAKHMLRERVQRGIHRAGARYHAIDDWREQSPPETWFDGHQRAILQKWRRRFEGAMQDEDSLIAA